MLEHTTLPVTGLTAGAEAPRILIADDDDTTRLILGQVMQEAGFDVVEAKDGRSCLELFETHSPSLVLLDVVMPGLDGYATCRRLRKTALGRTVPIIIMTSHADIDSVDAAFQAGATDFVSKPINYGVLPHRIRFILRANDTLEELDLTRAHLADAQRVAGLGNWFLDIESRRINASAEAMHLLGLREPSVELETLVNNFHPEDREKIENAFDDGFDHRAFAVEGRILTTEGLERVVGFRAEPIPGTTLHPRPNVAGTVQDLTEQRKHERLQLQLSVLGYTVSVSAGSADFDSLTEETLRRLVSALDIQKASLLLIHKGGTETVGLATSNGKAISVDAAVTVELSTEEQKLVERARVSSETVSSLIDGEQKALVPMILRNEIIGGILVTAPFDGSEEGLKGSTLQFLKTVSSQLAVALDRARLASEERQWQDREKRRLRADVAALTRSPRDAELVYRSGEMASLVSVIDKVGPTEATVLVTGESGTGKELIAKAVHCMSRRKEKRLVVVDCASIPTSLLESELFGYEKGAYTGAMQKKAGRLAEADGGTVILDEIGELALELQSKLLRFVQEKHFTPLGGTKPRRVDVRLVAVTNRDLAYEVEQKRFREDLFYRLNVVRLHVPPLRERADDAAHLAEYFASKYSRHYDLDSVKRFTAEALEDIERYPWPGNVRELQNRVMRAVILSESNALNTEDLGIDLTTPAVPSAPDAIPEVQQPIAASNPIPTGVAENATVTDPWQPVFDRLSEFVTRMLSQRPRRIVPAGRWLEDDLVSTAFELAGNVQAKGARLSGLAEATFRRRIQRITNGERPREWAGVVQALRRAIIESENTDIDLTWRLRFRLVTDLESKLSHESVRTGAAIMGVSVPTYRRWRQKVTSKMTPARQNDETSALN